jgi:hypothetical protein
LSVVVGGLGMGFTADAGIKRPTHRKPYHRRKAGTGDWLA